MKPKIRKAKKEDLEEVAEIYKQEYRKEPYNENWSNKNALKMVKGQFENSAILIALTDEKIAGFITFSKYPWEQSFRGDIKDFAVDSEFQGKGIGSKLLEKAEKESREGGAESIALSSHAKSKAFEFYKKKGYKRNEMVGMEKELK